MKFTQAIKMAMKSILSNKMRSFLTMLGIIIGISSVIVLIAIGNGSRQAITSAIQDMGTNLLTVSLTGNKAKSLTTADLTSLKSFSSIKDVAPQISGSVTAKAGTNSSTTSVEASVPEYEDIRDVHTALGRFISQDDIDNRYQVVDVGIEVLQNIYPDMKSSQYDSLIGQKISLNGTDFKIIGILESKGTSSSGSNDNRVIMPLSTGERFLKNKNVKTYYIGAKTQDDVNQATNELNMFFLQKYNDDSSQFRVLSQSQLLQTSSQTSNTLAMMLGGIASISLLVGGIGIMNIMLVSVVERTREIGIRKAIGAKRRDIMLQFLIEAIFISLVGGITGVLLGCGLDLILPGIINQPVVTSPSVVLGAFLFSAVVGIVFGIYPASKASKLKPIDALNYE
ncbi:MAG TPA: ABC transporter permease [Oscillospiraceae bacterium]|nr:ABC transporter permease [Oscillospiraceae bacterium]